VIFTSDNGGIVEVGNGNTGKAMTAGLAINGALRGGKHTEYEGGFREPFIVRWPGQVPANTVSDQVIALPDVLATLAAVLKVPLPTGAGEDSFNVLRAFTEATPGAPVRDHFIMQAADGTYALRLGDWKLIERVGAPKFEHRPTTKTGKKTHEGPKHDELFNLKDDPAETKDLSATHADHVAKMKRLLAAARDRGFTRPDAGK
jgi:arylsulfatase A-like enzyme